MACVLIRLSLPLICVTGCSALCAIKCFLEGAKGIAFIAPVDASQLLAGMVGDIQGRRCQRKNLPLGDRQPVC